jgi:cytochrome c
MIFRSLVFCVAAVAMAGAPAEAADVDRGGDLYESRCCGCHSLDTNRVGPMHRGVFGRKAGSVAGFAYSPAVRNATLVWNEATLDRWLANAQAVVPGTRMNFRVANAEDRADIIAFLKRESAR